MLQNDTYLIISRILGGPEWSPDTQEVMRVPIYDLRPIMPFTFEFNSAGGYFAELVGSKEIRLKYWFAVPTNEPWRVTLTIYINLEVPRVSHAEAYL